MPGSTVTSVKKKKKKLLILSGRLDDNNLLYVKLQETFTLDNATETLVSQLSPGLQVYAGKIETAWSEMGLPSNPDDYDACEPDELPEDFSTAAANF